MPGFDCGARGDSRPVRMFLEPLQTLRQVQAPATVFETAETIIKILLQVRVAGVALHRGKFGHRTASRKGRLLNFRVTFNPWRWS